MSSRTYTAVYTYCCCGAAICYTVVVLYVCDVIKYVYAIMYQVGVCGVCHHHACIVVFLLSDKICFNVDDPTTRRRTPQRENNEHDNMTSYHEYKTVWRIYLV